MLSCYSGMELRILKAPQLDSNLIDQILNLDRRNMQSILDEAGFLDYLRSWNNPDYIYIGSVQIEKRFRGTGLLLMLLDRFRTLVAEEDFTGFETNVQDRKSTRL